MQSNRRHFLKLSATGAAALSTMSAGATLSGCTSSSPATGMQVLRPEDLELLRALTPAVLKGKVASGDAAGIDETIQSFDTLMADLSAPVVAGVQQAFDVLSFGLTRGLTTGQWSAWSKASLEDAENALARLRDSGIGLLNAIYAAVIRLIISAWYLIPANAATTGYPGPPKKVSDARPAAVPAKEARP
ncbi:MAG: twin-arginine translocation pathway signal protein [Polyangiales bacterium]